MHILQSNKLQCNKCWPCQRAAPHAVLLLVHRLTVLNYPLLPVGLQFVLVVDPSSVHHHLQMKEKNPALELSGLKNQVKKKNAQVVKDEHICSSQINVWWNAKTGQLTSVSSVSFSSLVFFVSFHSPTLCSPSMLLWFPSHSHPFFLPHPPVRLSLCAVTHFQLLPHTLQLKQ